MESKKIDLDISEISVNYAIGSEVLESIISADPGDSEADQDNDL
ncbi:hypothetical protein [Marinomonas sp. THO17]